MSVSRFHLPQGLGLNLVLLVLLAALVAAPLATIAIQTLDADGIGAWRDVLASPLSPNLFWRPAGNTLVLGIGVACGCVLIGGFLFSSIRAEETQHPFMREFSAPL